MQALFAFGFLVLIAFLGSALFLRRMKVPAPVSFFFISGIVYIFLGVYLGGQGLNILSSPVLDGLEPLISLGLGWIGFLFGFQLESRYLKRFPGIYQGLLFLQFLFVFLLTGGVIAGVLKLLLPEQEGFTLYGLAAALGLLASLNSPTLLNVYASKLPRKGHFTYLARFLVSTGGFWGIIGLAALSSFWHYPFFTSGKIVKGSLFLLFSTLIPFLLGLIFHLLVRQKIKEQDLLVYLLGLVFFVSGIAFYFNCSPLYMCMILGITFSNLTLKQEKIYPLLLSTEKPLYVIFLVLIGALWSFEITIEVGILVAALLLLRFFGYILPLPAFGRILRFPFELPHLFGLCFISAGGVGVAFAVSIKLAYPVPLTDTFLSVSLLFIVFSELLSPLALRIALNRLEKEETK